ncbi:MAG: hypothetical protein O3A42_19525 [Actinobacteria bacterium]|nr:hypothetical protein [Actinomycetota bacterium]
MKRIVGGYGDGSSRHENNDPASAWQTPLFKKLGWVQCMSTATAQRRGRGRPSYGIQRHTVITSVPLDVRAAIDAVAAEAGVSRIVTISDLTAQALGRSDLTLRLPAQRDGALADVTEIAGHRPDCRGWISVTTQLPADLLPEIDALAAQTGASRGRVVANLVTHMVSRQNPDSQHRVGVDLVWPTSQQGRLPLAI